MRKRMLAMLLAVIMIISLLPTTAFAADATDVAITRATLNGQDITNGGTISNWAIEEDIYPLEIDVTLSGNSTNRSISIELEPGVKFSSLDLASIKKVQAVENATYIPKRIDDVDDTLCGTLKIDFVDGQNTSIQISLMLAADSRFLPIEASGGTRTIANAVKLSATDNNGTTTLPGCSVTITKGTMGVTGPRIYTIGSSSIAVPNEQLTVNTGFWEGFWTSTGGTRYGSMIDYLEIEYYLTEGLELDESVADSSYIYGANCTTKSWDEVSRKLVIRSDHLDNGAGSIIKIPLKVSSDVSIGQSYTIYATKLTIKRVASDTEVTQSWSSPGSSNAAVVMIGDPDVTAIVIEKADDVDEYESATQYQMQLYDRDQYYNTVLGAFTLRNDSAALNGSDGGNTGALTVTLDFDTTNSLVTGASIPVSTEVEALWPTSIKVTDAADKEYTLNQQQIAYLIRARDTITMHNGAVTFMLKTQDIPGYPDGVSMKKVEVSLPGLAKGYYCAPSTFVSGTRNH